MAGPASLYNLLNHHAPVKRIGRCPTFQRRTPADMRREVVEKRRADKAGSRARLARLRELKRQRNQAA